MVICNGEDTTLKLVDRQVMTIVKEIECNPKDDNDSWAKLLYGDTVFLSTDLFVSSLTTDEKGTQYIKITDLNLGE
jgi:hypothetical protein